MYRGRRQPLFIDVHTFAERSGQDAVLGRRGRGRAFRLVEAPDPDTARQCHQGAHGLLADEMYEVTEG